MQLALSTWHEVEDYLRTSRGIIVPIGSTEQHGPNGLIGTDHLDAEFVSKGVGDEIGCLVAPTLTIGMSQHHLGFAGSITLRPSTLIALVGDVVTSLMKHGFERFLFINGHGGNVATVTAAFDEIYAASSMRGPGEVIAGALQDGVLVAGAARHRAGQGTIMATPTAATPRRPRCRCRSTTIRRRSSTRRCRPRWRRGAPASSIAQTIAAAFPTAASGPIRRCPRRSTARRSTVRRSPT